MVDAAPAAYVLLQFRARDAIHAIAPALGSLVRSGHIHLLDLVFLEKCADDSVHAIEYDELGEFDDFAAIDGEVGGIIGPDDIEYASHVLPRGSAGALVVWEDVWAAPLLDALRSVDGVLVEGGLIPIDLMRTATAESAG